MRPALRRRFRNVEQGPSTTASLSLKDTREIFYTASVENGDTVREGVSPCQSSNLTRALNTKRFSHLWLKCYRPSLSIRLLFAVQNESQANITTDVCQSCACFHFCSHSSFRTAASVQTKLAFCRRNHISRFETNNENGYRRLRIR